MIPDQIVIFDGLSRALDSKPIESSTKLIATRAAPVIVNFCGDCSGSGKIADRDSGQAYCIYSKARFN